jgi:hypothetical protein
MTAILSYPLTPLVLPLTYTWAWAARPERPNPARKSRVGPGRAGLTYRARFWPEFGARTSGGAKLGLAGNMVLA